jgi:hypothetical protein
MKSVAALAAMVVASAAYAHRPYDGTDAAVADPGAIELELGVANLHEGDSRIVAVPDVVVTYGLSQGNEVGVEAHVNRVRDGLTAPYRTRVEDAAINWKHVLRKGSLQEAEGPSIAAECSLLLPQSWSDSHTLGAGCTGLVSHQWSLLTGHLNFGLERTPEHTNVRSLALIGEAPEDWPVRPGAELRWERDNSGGWNRSVRAGLAIPRGKNLAFDAAWQVGRSSDGPIHELRAGFTLSFD